MAVYVLTLGFTPTQASEALGKYDNNWGVRRFAKEFSTLGFRHTRQYPLALPQVERSDGTRYRIFGFTENTQFSPLLPGTIVCSRSLHG